MRELLWIMEPLIVLEAQEGWGTESCVFEWCLSEVGTERDGEAQVYSPKKEFGSGSNGKSGEASLDLRTQPQGESVLVPGD